MPTIRRGANTSDSRTSNRKDSRREVRDKKFLALSGSDPLTRSPDEAQEMFKRALSEWGDYVRIAKLPRM
jgi:hypothetical protein